MSADGIESIQFVRGTLTSAVIFHFLELTIESLKRGCDQRGAELIIILDNSKLSQSDPLFNFVILNSVKLLFTAPQSCFLNPIEMFFAFLKEPLKLVRCCNKYNNKQGGHRQSNRTGKIIDNE